MAIRLEAIAFIRLEAMASRLEAIAGKLEAMASRLEAIANRLEAIAGRLEAVASLSRLGIYIYYSSLMDGLGWTGGACWSGILSSSDFPPRHLQRWYSASACWAPVLSLPALARKTRRVDVLTHSKHILKGQRVGTCRICHHVLSQISESKEVTHSGFYAGTHNCRFTRSTKSTQEVKQSIIVVNSGRVPVRHQSLLPGALALPVERAHVRPSRAFLVSHTPWPRNMLVALDQNPSSQTFFTET